MFTLASQNSTDRKKYDAPVFADFLVYLRRRGVAFEQFRKLAPADRLKYVNEHKDRNGDDRAVSAVVERAIKLVPALD